MDVGMRSIAYGSRSKRQDNALNFGGRCDFMLSIQSTPFSPQSQNPLSFLMKGWLECQEFDLDVFAIGIHATLFGKREFRI